MKFTDNGLVLREVKTGESDRILTLLTPGHGIVSVMAKGSMKPKSRLFSASGLFSYSEWTLREGKNMYWADEAAPIEVFFGLRQDIESIALASYIAEILQILSPTGEEAEALLRLALNCLFLLAEKTKTPACVKAVFEMRALSRAGFAPDLYACAGCGEEEAPQYFFDVAAGEILCDACAGRKNLVPNLDGAVLKALRHITGAPPDRVFAFRLSAASMDALARVAEEFTLYHLDYPPKSLGFYQSLGARPENPNTNNKE